MKYIQLFEEFTNSLDSNLNESLIGTEIDDKNYSVWAPIEDATGYKWGVFQYAANSTFLKSDKKKMLPKSFLVDSDTIKPGKNQIFTIGFLVAAFKTREEAAKFKKENQKKLPNQGTYLPGSFTVTPINDNTVASINLSDL